MIGVWCGILFSSKGEGEGEGEREGEGEFNESHQPHF